MNNQQLIAELRELAEEEYKLFIEKLTPGRTGIMGVRVPHLRRIAKRIVKENKWHEFLECGASDVYEVELVRGFVLDYAPMQLNERIQRLQEFLPEVDTWAVCDTVYASIRRLPRLTKSDEVFVRHWVERLATDKRPFARRAACVVLLNAYCNADNTDWALSVLLKIKPNGHHYVQMGIAWALSMFYFVEPEKTLATIEKLTCQTTQRLAHRKINESQKMRSKEWKRKKS